jgi:hypothetical protein
LAVARHLPHGRHQAGTATSSSTKPGTTSPGPVDRISIKVEYKFAADRWWAAVEIGPDTAVEVGYVFVGPVELGVDVAELLAQWVTPKA